MYYIYKRRLMLMYYNISVSNLQIVFFWLHLHRIMLLHCIGILLNEFRGLLRLLKSIRDKSNIYKNMVFK